MTELHSMFKGLSLYNRWIIGMALAYFSSVSAIVAMWLLR